MKTANRTPASLKISPSISATLRRSIDTAPSLLLRRARFNCVSHSRFAFLVNGTQKSINCASAPRCFRANRELNET